MPDPVDRDDLPVATVSRPRRIKISVVWIIPILAAVIGLGIAIQRILQEGPTVTIVFRSAQGIEAGNFEELAAALRAGHTYANVHSTKWPSGEIRAQINDRANNN